MYLKILPVCSGFFFFKIYFNFICIFMGKGKYVLLSAVPKEARRGQKNPGAGVTGGSKFPERIAVKAPPVGPEQQALLRAELPLQAHITPLTVSL